MTQMQVIIFLATIQTTVINLQIDKTHFFLAQNLFLIHIHFFFKKYLSHIKKELGNSDHYNKLYIRVHT